MGFISAGFEKQHISYNQIHTAISTAVVEQEIYEKFQPTIILAIGGGGFVPARMLRTFLKRSCGKSLPIQTIGLILYDDDANGYDPTQARVRKTQWLNYGSGEGTGINLQGQRILIVDEVDDTRKTLSFAVSELQKDIDAQEADYASRKTASDPEFQAPKLGVFVVHNKKKIKAAQLPAEIMDNSYFACVQVEDAWLAYPWDSLDIEDHQLRADAREVLRVQSEAETPAGM
ncbi:MAG: hypothetical protein WDW38_008918 [Sanguina aurantia]